MNWTIGLGAPMPQIYAALDYYFARKAEHPTANITFTGHSLGGGLASLMAVYFDKQATVFDEAPFQVAALNPVITDSVGAYMIAKGYVDGSFADYLLSASTLALTRETNVTHYYVEGEALDYPLQAFWRETWAGKTRTGNKREAGNMQYKAAIRRWAIAIQMMILGGGMSACADGASWKEEVLLHDGSRIVVERSVVRKGRHEPFQRPTIGEQRLKFTHPETGRRVIWEDPYSEDLGSANFLPMMLEIDKDAAYLVASPMGCLSYNKWGRPNPPYVVFKYQGKTWNRIALQELPTRFKTPNLIISSPDDAAKKAGADLVTAEMVSRINNAPKAGGSEKPHLKRIVREPLKLGSLGVSCEELVFYKGAWVSPGDSIGRRMMDRMSK